MDDVDVKRYREPVRTVVAKLLLLFSLLLMPLGMTPAAAASQQQHAMAAMPMGHCDEQAPRHESKGSPAECTMACASALPAGDYVVEQPLASEPLFIAPVPAPMLHGLHPDPGTPPPKTA